MALLPKLLLALCLAAAIAWWPWRGRLDRPLAWLALLARGAALLALLLLILDPGLPAARRLRRPIVLLDHSISMHATGGQARQAAESAASAGDTVAFGELAPGIPAARSTLAGALQGAVTAGRPVVVVTDGEIADTDAIPAALLAETSVRLFPRHGGPDAALVDIRAPTRLSVGDSLVVEVEAARTSDAADTATIELRAGAHLLARGVLRFGGTLRGRLTLAAALPESMRGEQWLEIGRAGAPDAEPGDDTRWWLLDVTPAPGIVVIAASPDWDARALYRAIKDVANAPVRGFVQLQAGKWRRMDDLRPVTAEEVRAAARAADLVAVRGDPAPWRGLGRAHLIWPIATASGDWYLLPGGLSPVAGAFVGVDPDSLPPLAAVLPARADSGSGWVGAAARLARRGVSVAVVRGMVASGGRTVQFSADGWYRWAFRGGVSDQAWRALVAAATSWLLATAGSDSTLARPILPVTQAGRSVRFRWTGGGPPQPVAISWQADSVTRNDTLRFDGAGEASLALKPGRYHYRLDGGGEGSFGVEPYSDELVPGPVTLTARQAIRAPSAPRQSLRGFLVLFAIAVAGFATEWLLRRRLGLR